MLFASKPVITPTGGKKKFDFFFSESENPIDLSPPAQAEKFVGQVVVGPLDCSIGSIFRDDFQNSFSKLKADHQTSVALSVLIVDDSIIHRKLTQRILGGMIDEVMWMVEGAENGERAMQLVQTSPRRPDVIIIDQHMEPGGGRLLGHEVVALLRQDPAFKNIVIIGCTGSADQVRDDLLLAGCDAVWSKPIPTKSEAQAQIVHLLQQKRNAEHNPSTNSPADVTANDTYECSVGSISSDDIGSDMPVFRQVKTARLSYHPPGSLLPPPHRGGGALTAGTWRDNSSSTTFDIKSIRRALNEVDSNLLREGSCSTATS
jgi:CheY-like chemotaxis protein